ncbi:MAG: hypothetical protein DCC68_13685 [Planctomycetota bacterium]|nr:MAG: hypothetical protein DCC68_13685 [Planctomycetota bacterium]
MNTENLSRRLSHISTLWAKLSQAHGVPEDEAAVVRRDMFQRYCGAAYYYLLGAVRDEEVALDLFQEFALRFLRGDFERVAPERGRFRDYLKTALVHLVTDYHRTRKSWPRPLPADLAAPSLANGAPADDAAELIANWREELVTHAWASLARLSPKLYEVLLLNAQNPDLSSRDIADRLSARLGKRTTSTAVRVALHRARQKFAQLLVDEVRRSLDAPSDAELIQELRDLRLLGFCCPPPNADSSP